MAEEKKVSARTLKARATREKNKKMQIVRERLHWLNDKIAAGMSSEEDVKEHLKLTKKLYFNYEENK